MSLSINTNTAAMAALQSLSQTTSDLTKTENAVSTGKSVNSASDNPAMYSIAQNMTAQISTLSGVSTGLSFSAQVLNTATQGLSSITTALQSLATNLGTNTTGVDNSTLNDAISKTLASIDSAASGAKFQGVNLLSGATGNGTTYTSLSTAMDAQGSTFTQNGFNVTSAGLGLSNLSMDMSGSSLALGSSTNSTAFATNNVIQMQNVAAAGTGGTVSASNPAITYDFVASTGTTDDQSTVLQQVGKAVGLDTSDLTLNGNGQLTSSSGAIASQTTASDGSTTYKLSNGDSIVQSKDGNGNSVYTANTGFDSNGNVTTKSVITDVNMSSAASLSSSGGSSSAQSVQQVSLMTQAMEYQGFGVSRDASNNLTIAGNSISATSTQMGTFQSSAATTISLSSTPFSTTDYSAADGSNPAAGGTSEITVGNNIFVAQTKSPDNSALNVISTTIGSGGLTDLKVDSTTGKLTATAGSVTLGSGTTNSDGSTTYALTNTSDGTAAGSISQSTDKQGNAVYSYTSSTGANTVVTNVDMPNETGNQVTAMQQAMAAQGITATADSSNNLTVTPPGNVAVSMGLIDTTGNVYTNTDPDRTIAATSGATIALGSSTTATAFGTNNVLQIGSTVSADDVSTTNPVVTRDFVANTKGSSDTTALTTLAGAAGFDSTKLTLDSSGALKLTSDPTYTLGAGTTTDGVTTYNVTKTSDSSAAGTITQSTDSDGNAVYSYTSADQKSKTVITDVDMTSASSLSQTGGTSSPQSAQQVNLMAKALKTSGLTASVDANNNLTVTGSNVANGSSTSLGSVSAAGAYTSATTSTPAKSGAVFTQGAAQNGFTGKATAVTGASVVSAVVQAAISNVTQKANVIGYSSNTISNLQTTTSSLSNALTTGVGALTDADLASESAKLTSLQTKQQLAVQALSIANSQSSTLLSLFRG